MGITKSRGQKSSLDKLYTTDSNAVFAVEKIDLTRYDLAIEPSAGGGAFIRAIPDTIKLLSYDLKPEEPKIIKKDWFEVNISNEYHNVLVIGNPPYGQKNSLAINFMNHAASFPNVKTIAFILPKSFRKITVQERIDLNFHLVSDYDLPNNNFILDGEKHKVKTCFQVYERKNTRRIKSAKRKTTSLFSFVSDPTIADLRIQRVGGRAGKASRDLNSSSASNYWIKLDKKIPAHKINDFIKIVNNIAFPTVDYTVGPKSLSIDELINTLESSDDLKSYIDQQITLFTD